MSLLAIGAVAAVVSADQAQWVAASAHGVHATDPDSALHARRAIEVAQQGVGVRLRALIEPGYYPNLGRWSTAFGLDLVGATTRGVRLALVPWTALWIVGTGLLGRRLGGDAAGPLAAVLLCLVPLPWVLRSDTLLDVQLCALLTLGVALVPAGPGEGSRTRALACGLALGGAALSKIVGLPLGAAVLGAALVGAMRSGDTPARRAWVSAAVVAAVVAIPWTAFSAGAIAEGLDLGTARARPLTVASTLAMGEYVARGLLPLPLLWLSTLGLALAARQAWHGRGSVLPPMLALVAGAFVAAATFPTSTHGSTCRWWVRWQPWRPCPSRGRWRGEAGGAGSGWGSGWGCSCGWWRCW